MGRPKKLPVLQEEDPSAVEPKPKKARVPRSMEFLLRQQAKRTEAIQAVNGSHNHVSALSLAIRHFPGGRWRFIEFVKLAYLNGDPAATAFWTIWSELRPRDQPRISLDDIVVRAGIKVSQLLAGVVGHGVEAMSDTANLIAASFHPSVMEAMAKSALKLESEIGQKDRELFLQARGSLPVPKGTSIHLHANASANAAAAAATAADPSVPKFAEDLEALTLPKTTVRRQLAESQVTVEGSVVSSQS